MRHSSLIVGSLLVTLTACDGLASSPVAASAPAIEPVVVESGDAVGPAASPGTGYTFKVRSVYDLEEAMDLASPCNDCLDGFEAMIEEISDGSCPQISRYENSYIEITGDCVTSGLVYLEGSARIHSNGSERITTFENFALYGERAVFEAHGSYRMASSASGTERSYNLSYTWIMGTDRDGSFAYDLDRVERDGTFLLSGEVKTDAGSFAVEASSAPVEGCADEPVATVTVLGDDEAVLMLDGGKSCDACGEFSQGGGATETVCR